MHHGKRAYMLFILAMFLVTIFSLIEIPFPKAEANPHRWMLSKKFATCEEVVEFLNKEHPDVTAVVTDEQGYLRVIYED